MIAVHAAIGAATAGRRGCHGMLSGYYQAAFNCRMTSAWSTSRTRFHLVSYVSSADGVILVSFSYDGQFTACTTILVSNPMQGARRCAWRPFLRPESILYVIIKPLMIFLSSSHSRRFGSMLTILGVVLCSPKVFQLPKRVFAYFQIIAHCRRDSHHIRWKGSSLALKFSSLACLPLKVKALLTALDCSSKIQLD